MRSGTRLALLLLIPAIGMWALYRPHSIESPSRRLHGVVLDEKGPIAGARIRWQGELRSVLSRLDGSFELPGRPDPWRRVTAWKKGYFIAGEASHEIPLTLRLTPLPEHDNESYSWVDATPDSAHRQNCGNCHSEIHAEWSSSGHARSASNKRFLNLYDGTDWQNRPHVGWGLRDDHPDGIGVCNACHAPSAPFDADLRTLTGVAAHGVHCDFCHKITKASTERIGFTHGRYGLDLLRPKRGQIFLGSLDDVDRGEDSYLPLYRDSKYCASCHEGVVFGVPVYTTYSEWLASSARQEGKQCQSCHMAPTGSMPNIAPGKGGIKRDPHTLANHRFFGPSQKDMLRRCLHVSIEAKRHSDFLEATVEIRADQVGHRVPTGFVDRNLLLVVEALGPADSSPPPTAGQRLPALAGESWAGKAGRLYAKRLTDFDGRTPVPFWRARPEVEDNRLVAGQPDIIQWRLDPTTTRLRLRLIYRRFWPETSKVKGWPSDEIVVFDHEMFVDSERNVRWSSP
jgi:hypothetical protein